MHRQFAPQFQRTNVRSVLKTEAVRGESLVRDHDRELTALCRVFPYCECIFATRRIRFETLELQEYLLGHVEPIGPRAFTRMAALFSATSHAFKR